VSRHLSVPEYFAEACPDICMENLLCPQFFTSRFGHLADGAFLELLFAGLSEHVGDRDFLELKSTRLSENVRDTDFL
jgi:hypothetical protein